jgi:hypothetical protein
MGIANDINQGGGVRSDWGARSPGGGNATTADFSIAKKYGLDPGQYEARVREYASRLRDYLNSDNSFMDNLGNHVAGAFGVAEMTPEFVASKAATPTNASWGFDPIKAAATIAGTALGAPGLAAVYEGIKSATGWSGPQIEIGFGGFANGGPPMTRVGSGNGQHDPSDPMWPAPPSQTAMSAKWPWHRWRTAQGPAFKGVRSKPK